jgi:m7GpppX diphosphatase
MATVINFVSLLEEANLFLQQTTVPMGDAGTASTDTTITTKQVTDLDLLKSPFPLFVGTSVNSLAHFRPTFGGYLMPSPQWALVARRYEATLAKSGNNQAGLYPLNPKTSFFPTDIDITALFASAPENFFTNPAIIAFITAYKGSAVILYQTNSSPSVDSIKNIANISGQQTHHNNEWFCFENITNPLISASLTMIYPAAPWQIRKYTDVASILLTETGEDYFKFHKPIVDKATADPIKLQWLYDVIDGKKEQDTVVIKHDDPEHGFVVAKDSKWSLNDYNRAMQWSAERTPENNDSKLPFALAKSMWLLMLPIRRDVKSIRDLNQDHLPMLKQVKKEVLEYVKKMFGFEQEDIVMYFHYVPTFYHFHIHINHVSALTETTFVGKCEELDQVIDNISLLGDYYTNCTRRVYVPVNHPLAEAFSKK